MLHSKYLPTSTALERIWYKDGVLGVTFRSGRSYEYIGVPINSFYALQATASAGHYLNTHIKGHYPQHYVTGTGRDIT